MGAREDLIDAYQVLGVAPDATQAELKAAHRRLVRRHHPDLAPPDKRATATRRVQRINVAYGLVHDQTSRTAYDRLRAAQRRQRAVTVADSELAQAWDQLLGQAGRWAGAWWARNRAALERSGVRAALGASRAGRELVGRVAWVAYCLAGALTGLVAALAAGEFALDRVGALTPVAGLLVGWALGSDRGRRRRHRMAGLPPPRRPAVMVPLLALAGIASALAVDRLLASL